MKNLFQKKEKIFRLTILPLNLTLTIDSEKTILQSLLDQGIAFPHRCRVGSCTTCASKLIEGQVKELTDKTFVLDEESLKENYILICQSIPKSDLIIENPRAAVTTRSKVQN
ncbi:MAG: 2Fe-2S iron-sulfur cluster-binding protein [Leptospiraceae bacterium]|nr:2Fe-2S iron-sulfur cluster-binding protein [Leptospiraceae bacterium]